MPRNGPVSLERWFKIKGDKCVKSIIDTRGVTWASPRPSINETVQKMKLICTCLKWIIMYESEKDSTICFFFQSGDRLVLDCVCSRGINTIVRHWRPWLCYLSLSWSCCRCRFDCCPLSAVCCPCPSYPLSSPPFQRWCRPWFP